MIIVIGGSGFIGTRLCRRLVNSGKDFYIVNKVQSKTFPDRTVVANVRNYDAFLKDINGNVIINLAAAHRDDVTPKSLYYEVNVGGAENVCKVAEEKGINTFDMNTLVATIYHALGKKKLINIKLPYIAGYAVGKAFDMVAIVTGKKFPISYIRVKKFCSNSCFETNIVKTGFIPPLSIREGLLQTIHYEFIERQSGNVFYSE